MSPFARRDRPPRVARPVRLLLRRHPDETGMVLYVRSLRRFVPRSKVRTWGSVTVTPARSKRSRSAELAAWLDDARIGRDGAEPGLERDVRRGELRSGPPMWLGLDPGEHAIDFDGFGEPLRSQTVRLGPGDRFLIAYRPPVRLPSGRTRRARWTLRALPGEPA